MIETEAIQYMEVITYLQRTPHKSEVIRTFNFISTLDVQSCAWAVTSNHRERQESLRAHGVYQLLLFGFPNESSSHDGLKPVFVLRNEKFSEWKYNGTCLKRNRGIIEHCLCWNRVIWSSDDLYLHVPLLKRHFLKLKNFSGPCVSVIGRFNCATLRHLQVVNLCVVHPYTLRSLYWMLLSAVCKMTYKVCWKLTEHTLHYTSEILVLCYR